MKKILILLIVLGGLIGAAVLYQKQQNAVLNTAATRGVKVRDKLLPDLDITAVKQIRIKDAKSEVNVKINADRKGAKVFERGGYAASLDRINTALSELYEQRIASKQQVGKSAWAEIHVQPPGEGTDGIGTQIELIGEEGKILESLILGDQISTAGGRSSTQFDGGAQRFIRIPKDGDTIWVVSNTFFDMEPKPESWLDKDFFDVQKIKEVTVTPTEAVEGWKVGRPDEVTQEFKLLDAKVGEGLDSSKLTITSLLSTPTFNDVVPKDKAEEVMKDAISAKILTFDGFTYDVKVAKQSKDGSDRYFISFTVSADIPKERPPVKDEKEEDKKKADEAFASRKKAQEEKLAKEQKFAGWAFEVSEYTVNNLFKKRSEIVMVEAKSEPVPAPIAPAAPTPSAATSATPAPGIPELNPNQVSVTTPPVQAPAPVKPDLKPESAPDAAPVVEEKK